MNESLLVGRNPIMEALKSGREIEKIIVQKNAEGSIKKICAMATEQKIPLQYSEKKVLDRIADGAVHQGVVAHVSAHRYAEIEEVFAKAEEKGEPPLVIILDGIEDPHNLGAIIRSADGAGAHGIIIPKRHAVGITQTVVKASAGAIEYVPVVKAGNLTQTIEQLKEKGLWIAAVDMAGDDYGKKDLTGGLALVIGNEGSGISRLVKESCDFSVKIPMSGNVNSLNASNAAAVLLFEIRRQRMDAKVAEIK